MKKSILIFASAVVVITTGMLACNSSDKPSASQEGLSDLPNVKEAISQDSLVKRGQYLVTIMGCNDCHSPKKFGPHGPEIDSSRMLSGHPSDVAVTKPDMSGSKNWIFLDMQGTAAAGPWGVSFAANLTSDPSGIGNWTEEQFFTAIRQGKFKGAPAGRDLLPPMPWPMYRNATDEDLRSVFAYLKSTNPVKNFVPSNIPPNQLSQLK
ncbi:MAG TPA: diheme cytochrome c-553 [Flavisolibacter sp.]|jgi:hypothetical protein|nr:diheme cytochrome c-553 [Flavisolibacter sp.]